VVLAACQQTPIALHMSVSELVWLNGRSPQFENRGSRL